MKIKTSMVGGLLMALIVGCGRSPSSSNGAPPKAAAGDPILSNLAVALVPQVGETASDQEIRRCQERVRAGIKRDAWIERLGWAFVSKAHESFDPGYYKLAQVCSVVLETNSPGAPEGLLLEGHVLDSLHRFKDAEPIARKLVAGRGLSYDYALLGDVLMEQGRLEEAVPAYQKAMDLRPDLHSYARASYMRWLTGDMSGAIELMQAAVGATSPVDPSSVAWTCSKLAALDFQAGNNRDAEGACHAALAALSDYPPALLMQGRMRLAAGHPQDAVAPLERAARGNPLPDTQWALADALRAADRQPEAEKVEALLRSRGAAGDPRTFSLYLATRGEDVDLAVKLARQELLQRQDIFTHDALAWALAASNRLPEAQEQMDKALATGTDDARLFFHAASIAFRGGEIPQAREWIARATELKQMLLPSERDQLDRLAASAGESAHQFPVSESLEAGKPKPRNKEKS